MYFNFEYVCYVIFNNLTFLFHIVNSSVNDLIYKTLSKQYRAAVMQSLCCLCRRSGASPVERNARANIIRVGNRETHL